MERTNFEKLQVYRLSEKIADSIWNIVIDWNSLARDTVGKQIIRSADSIGANIAEGSGRGSLQDNRRFENGPRILVRDNSLASSLVHEKVVVAVRSEETENTNNGVITETECVSPLRR